MYFDLNAPDSYSDYKEIVEEWIKTYRKDLEDNPPVELVNYIKSDFAISSYEEAECKVREEEGLIDGYLYCILRWRSNIFLEKENKSPEILEKILYSYNPYDV